MPETKQPLENDDSTNAKDALVESNTKKAEEINDFVSSINPIKEDLKNASEESLSPLIDIALKDLQAKRNQLNQEIEALKKRKSDLETDIQSSFAGKSDAIARRVKGFQDYLTGAFQDLAQSAEQLELVVQPVVMKPSPLDENQPPPIREEVESINAIADTFKPDESLIRECLEQFLGQPDFYADPWKLRRSLEQKDIELLEDWFFSMGGRGAQPSRGTRSNNDPGKFWFDFDSWGALRRPLSNPCFSKSTRATRGVETWASRRFRPWQRRLRAKQRYRTFRAGQWGFRKSR